jgi:DNA mismatch repair protein MutS
MLIDDYIDYSKKYKDIYGIKTVVLMQVGSFFEFYGIPDKKLGCDVDDICNILEIQSTRKNKSNSMIDKNNPKMAGIPLYVVNKYINILTENNYTIVLIEQTTLPPNPKREVTKIISPGTNIDINNDVNNNFLMCIYFSLVLNKNKNNIIAAYISYVDVNTNETFIINCEENETNINLEDTLKSINNIRPSEIVLFTDIHTKNNHSLINTLDSFVRVINSNICLNNRIHLNIDDGYFKLSYQKTILKKIFKNTGLLSVIEYLDLEKYPLSVISFTYLLQFCYEHNEVILNGLNKPKILENTNYLSLVNNALENLNIISNSKNTGKTSCVLNLLNNCKTNMGKRFFKHSLINPITNVNILNERYEYCEKFIYNNTYIEVRKILSKICDLERFFKKIILKTLQPPEFVLIISSLLNLDEIFNILLKNNMELSDFSWSNQEQDLLINLINDLSEKLIYSEMEKVNLSQISKNIFKEGIYAEIDDIQKELLLLENLFENVCFSLNEGNPNNTEIKLELNKDKIASLTITKNRFENLLKDKKRSDRIDELLRNKCRLSLSDFSSKPYSANNKTLLKLSFKGMLENQSKITEMQNEIKTKVTELYLKELECFYENYGNLFENINSFISKVDFYCCNAKNAVENYYTKPKIVDRNVCDDSYIIAEKIRHPLIENIQTDTQYVSNDIEIGTDNNKGMLLYGYNGIGKTSLLKSIGISLILAQSGCFVPCKTFEYVPYRHIFSRIPSGDNLFKNQSTFQVEISELRSILKRSTNNSLIISDELCSGTENLSAISLIGSTIHTLSKKNASFLMASHLHEITDLECIKKIKNINVFHMEVTYDNEKDILVYNRTLKKGQGSRIYGLEVCKAMELPEDFLYMANQIRQDILGLNRNILEPKASKYNKEVFFDVCNICNKKTDEIHHIKPQKDANENGIIIQEQIHKNIKSNLMNVCEECHDKIHSNMINVKGFIQTSEGVKLDVTINKNDCTNYENRIKELRNEGKSYNKILEIISSEFKDENFTIYKVKKYLKN